MALEIETREPQSQPAPSGLVVDNRQHRRVPLTLLGRFMRANRQEYPCKLVDISVGGASLMSPVAVENGETIVVYLDHLGGLEGRVVRQLAGGFAMTIQATQHKREKIAAQLTWLINRHELDPVEARQHERVIPRNPTSTITVADDEPRLCQVIDVSISGASIATELRPDLGAEISLGKLRSRVVRHHDRGIAVRFLDIQQPTALRRYFG